MTLWAEIARLTDEGRPFVVATVIATQGSTPQKPGSKMVVLEGGAIRGTVGGGAIEQQIIAAAVELLANPASEARTIETHLTHELGMCCGGRMTVFLEKQGAAARLVLFGAGHVALELAGLAHRVGFQVTVVDERRELASSERFPRARLVHEAPADIARAEPGGLTSYFCVLTHDHALDQQCVEALVRKPRAYLGVIGSRRKAERFRQRMRAAGFSDVEVGSFESPMGVDIEALTPAEIAVSISARLIAVRRFSGSRGPKSNG